MLPALPTSRYKASSSMMNQAAGGLSRAITRCWRCIRLASLAFAVSFGGKRWLFAVRVGSVERLDDLVVVAAGLAVAEELHPLNLDLLRVGLRLE
jgi:hypothetical protein